MKGVLKWCLLLTRTRSGEVDAGRLKKQVGESTYAAHYPLK